MAMMRFVNAKRPEVEDGGSKRKRPAGREVEVEDGGSKRKR